ncbi:uncharacterized protein LOC125064076 isoform X2 [Vanessa atalanta]|uniref:uncharacterized protein LOC125064076 isoform X2 n=1 Tax=Vanessa atalanta TaxID=42275 RepID=UPI001FCE0C3C|nr:uncharacterized protein LOC125064076 isoform X2 [Vanessa atalanta]
MFRNNLILAFTVSLVIFTLVAENEVQAAPEPCNDLLDVMWKPEKLKKPKEEKHDNGKDKHKKEKLKQIKKLLAMILEKK